MGRLLMGKSNSVVGHAYTGEDYSKFAPWWERWMPLQWDTRDPRTRWVNSQDMRISSTWLGRYHRTPAYQRSHWISRREWNLYKKTGKTGSPRYTPLSNKELDILSSSQGSEEEVVTTKADSKQTGRNRSIRMDSEDLDTLLLVFEKTTIKDYTQVYTSCNTKLRTIAQYPIFFWSHS